MLIPNASPENFRGTFVATGRLDDKRNYFVKMNDVKYKINRKKSTHSEKQLHKWNLKCGRIFNKNW